jgi:hypothetical protein
MGDRRSTQETCIFERKTHFLITRVGFFLLSFFSGSFSHYNVGVGVYDFFCNQELLLFCLFRNSDSSGCEDC